MSKIVLNYITAKDRNEAVLIGRQLVTKRLAACVNVLDGMRSVYWWEGKVSESSEAVLIAKTEQRLVKRLTAEVKRLHSYSVVCVLSLNVASGNAPYMEWLLSNLRKKNTRPKRKKA